MKRHYALAATAAVLLSACGGSPTPTEQPTTAGTEGGDSGTTSDTLTVFAAASLRSVMEPIARDFSAEHPGTEVAFSFAGSADLVTQIANGAPADVLVTADESNMRDAVDNADVDADTQVIATNYLVLVTPPDNPAGITEVTSMPQDTALVLCAPQVPCGRAATELAERLSLTLTPVSEENSVTDVLGKITSGQGDAGLVYRTDATLAGDGVHTIEIPGFAQAANLYPAGVVVHTSQPDLAQSFVDYLSSEDAQAHLSEAGFGTP